MTVPENLNLDDLRKKAEAATKGEWLLLKSKVPHDGQFDFAISAPNYPVLAEAYGRTSNGGIAPSEANAAYIVAAQPKAVIGLIDELDAARKRIAELEEALRPFDAAVFNDNGDVTYDFSSFDAEDLCRARTTLNGGKQP